MELEGNVAIVTGAGNGIGEAIARKLFAEGARVALWDMNFESVQKLAALLDPKGDKAAAFKVNVTVEAEVQTGVRRDGRAVRPHRHPGQQRRHLPAQAPSRR